MSEEGTSSSEGDAGGDEAEPEVAWAVSDTGLKTFDEVVGDGETPAAGDVVSVSYVGWLDGGKVFDDSKGEPFSFKLGEGQVIPGWDEGIATMQVGGTRNLVIPYALGYGEEGAGSTIPPRSTLNFECKLLGVEKSTALKEATMLLGRFGFGANPFTFVFSLFLLTFVIPTETLQQLGLK